MATWEHCVWLPYTQHEWTIPFKANSQPKCPISLRSQPSDWDYQITQSILPIYALYGDRKLHVHCMCMLHTCTCCVCVCTRACVRPYVCVCTSVKQRHIYVHVHVHVHIIYVYTRKVWFGQSTIDCEYFVIKILVFSLGKFHYMYIQFPWLTILAMYVYIDKWIIHVLTCNFVAHANNGNFPIYCRW